MIVVAEKQVVYEKFPIPLINRLEKHFLAMNTMLTEEQKVIVARLDEWANMFAKIDNTKLDGRRFFIYIIFIISGAFIIMKYYVMC